MFAHLVKLILQLFDASLHFPPVHFQLGFARSSQANSTHTTGSSATSAGLTGKVRPGPCQAGQPVLELGKLHLEHSLFRVGMQRENIQD